jgi:phosphopantothenoylcysteine synthetase/decarboxylase
MNGKMWMHPATVANVEILRQRGANFIGPEKGMLACGYEGSGVSGRSTTSSPKRLNTRSADAQHARQRKK